VEQVDSESPFQARDRLRHGRLADHEVGGRRVHPAVVDDGEEVAELADVH
jgi:hypothetical protein